MDPRNHTTPSFVGVDMDIIATLKEKGFKNIQLNLLLTDDRSRATIEIIPSKEQDFGLSSVALNSADLLNYFDGPSPMARYVIDRKYL